MKHPRPDKEVAPEKEAKEVKPAVTHGELNPTPEVAPENENKKEGGSEEGLVTAPPISAPAESFVIKNDERADHAGRSMGVIGPRES